MSDPWMKFYPQDWRADEKLRLCSLAARGLWVELLALMHRSEKYGRLLIAGKRPSAAQIAVQVGASKDEVEPLLAELEEAGVFSRDANGVIYSRRMKRDEKKSKIARKNGKAGGNPKLRKQREIPQQDNLEDKGGVKPQKPEARSQSNSVSNDTGGKPADPVKDLFDLGVAILIEGGETEKSARSLIGKWRKGKGGDARVLQALLDCRAQSISNPTEWLSKVLTGTKYVSESGYEYRGTDDQVMREAERRGDWATYYAVRGKAA